MSSIDIFVPNYNYGRFLTTCVNSILGQEGVDVRVLILDDASTDESELVGRALARQDARVEYRRHATNHGHIATYNEGLEWTAATYNMLLSADDVLTPGALARVTRLMDAHPGVTLAYGRDIPFSTPLPPPLPEPLPDRCDWRISTYREFLEASCDLGHTPINTPTAVVRTGVHREIGGYLPDHPHSGDTEVWLRLAARGSIGWVDALQAFRRVHGRNMSFDYSLLRRLEEHKRAFDEHFRTHRADLPDMERFRERIHKTLAYQAFWLGSRSFDGGDAATCRTCLDAAAAWHPPIRQAKCWARLEWKRRCGTTAWRALRPVADLLRHLG
jgi:glycosyltransferase involved in cell wall biosynthesis